MTVDKDVDRVFDVASSMSTVLRLFGELGHVVDKLGHVFDKLGRVIGLLGLVVGR